MRETGDKHGIETYPRVILNAYLIRHKAIIMIKRQFTIADRVLHTYRRFPGVASTMSVRARDDHTVPSPYQLIADLSFTGEGRNVPRQSGSDNPRGWPAYHIADPVSAWGW